MQQTELAPARNFTAVVTGTHSSGKSTLLADLEKGKLSDLGIHPDEYDDFGFGIIPNSKKTELIPLILVPEAARWLAKDIYQRPNLLAGKYSLGFQLEIDNETIMRIHAAHELTRSLRKKLVDTGLVAPDVRVGQPVVISDRGPIDGLVYSSLRVERETDIIGSYPRTGFMSEWLRTFVDLVFITDHNGVPFQQESARLNDTNFRDRVAKSIELNYGRFFERDSIVTLQGDRKSRKERFVTELSQRVAQGRPAYTSQPYTSWFDVTTGRVA